MDTNNTEYDFDAVVIGAGHAGCEAALALARKGHKTLIATINLDAIAFCACNPSIGGTAKGQLVCEIDALGGEMGKNTDRNSLQIRMLNDGKGPAVHSLRAQVDKLEYHNNMKRVLEENDNITIKQAEVKKIFTENGKVIGIETVQGEYYKTRCVVVATGVYLKSRIIIGEYTKEIGPNGFARAENLTQSLIDLGLTIYRFKTGTPARLNGMTIDFSKMEEQSGDENIQTFSFMTEKQPKNISKCFLTYTNSKTHEIIKNNLSRAPMFSGMIKGIGPRYCPSIEDKVVRFAERERHQTFLEPESLATHEYYVQGISTSMPIDVQKQIYHSISGLENAKIMRDAYAIEYDCIDSTQLYPTLECKFVEGLFFAGQVNGTSGYEEAAAQGLMAGINAGLKLENQEQIILDRSQAYIGVLIDDLVTKGTNEPYRMMTSRAEYRLVLRQDNADVRLTEIGRKICLVDDARYEKFTKKMENIAKIRKILQNKVKISEKLLNFYKNHNESSPNESVTFYQMLKRPNIDIFDVKKEFDILEEYNDRELEFVNTEIKYEGYISQEQEDIEKFKKQESLLIPDNFDYMEMKGIRMESKQKLSKIKPKNIGQASRISGVSPADITILIMYIKSGRC